MKMNDRVCVTSTFSIGKAFLDDTQERVAKNDEDIKSDIGQYLERLLVGYMHTICNNDFKKLFAHEDIMGTIKKIPPNEMKKTHCGMYMQIPLDRGYVKFVKTGIAQ